jgi:hypothetical protein
LANHIFVPPNFCEYVAEIVSPVPWYSSTARSYADRRRRAMNINGMVASNYRGGGDPASIQEAAPRCSLKGSLAAWYVNSVFLMPVDLE